MGAGSDRFDCRGASRCAIAGVGVGTGVGEVGGGTSGCVVAGVGGTSFRACLLVDRGKSRWAYRCRRDVSQPIQHPALPIIGCEEHLSSSRSEMVRERHGWFAELATRVWLARIRLSSGLLVTALDFSLPGRKKMAPRHCPRSGTGPPRSPALAMS